jgi:hypothetical protein
MAKSEQGTKEVIWASADPDNPEEWLEFLQQQGERAGDRIRTELKRLQALGIIDADGNRLKKELPPDMRPGSTCTLAE